MAIGPNGLVVVVGTRRGRAELVGDARAGLHVGAAQVAGHLAQARRGVRGGGWSGGSARGPWSRRTPGQMPRGRRTPRRRARRPPTTTPMIARRCRCSGGRGAVGERPERGTGPAGCGGAPVSWGCWSSRCGTASTRDGPRWMAGVDGADRVPEAGGSGAPPIRCDANPGRRRGRRGDAAGRVATLQCSRAPPRTPSLKDVTGSLTRILADTERASGCDVALRQPGFLASALREGH